MAELIFRNAFTPRNTVKIIINIKGPEEYTKPMTTLSNPTIPPNLANLGQNHNHLNAIFRQILARAIEKILLLFSAILIAF